MKAISKLRRLSSPALLAACLWAPLAPPQSAAPLPAAPDAVLPHLRSSLQVYYDFEHPAADDAGRELDQGLSHTDLTLLNGRERMRVQEGAVAASRSSLQVIQINPRGLGNDDWKAGVFAESGVRSLAAFDAVKGITMMTWVKMIGDGPGWNTNTPEPDDRYNAMGLFGLLSGSSDGHGVRAMIELINVDGVLRLVAIGRRSDDGRSQTFAARDDWHTLLPHAQWVHIAASYDFRNAQLRLYRNGQPLEGSYTLADDPWAVGKGGDFASSATLPRGIKIGGSFPQNTQEKNPCNCRLDDVMLLDRVATQLEINQQYRWALSSKRGRLPAQKPAPDDSRGQRDPPPDPHQIPVPPVRTAFPHLPGVAELPSQVALPPALRRSTGAAITTAADWPARRAEMRRILEHYAVGHAPPAPGNVRGEVLQEQALRQGQARYRLIRLSFGPSPGPSFDIGVFTPAGAGPFPVVIAPFGPAPGARSLPRLEPGPGQGTGVDALISVGPGAKPTRAPAPAAVAALDPEVIAREQPALARGFAYVVFDHNDCGEDTTLRDSDGSWAFRRTRLFPAYPGYDWGLLGAWAWGVSRIVDHLQTDPSIDARGIVVTGHSRTGKSALIAGAFDERIAVTAPIATGGGGMGAFRYSGAGRGGKEGLDVMLRKYPNWFSPELHPFWGHTDRLPFDQHWFWALVAPRALVALEGDTDPVSLANAVRQSWLGAEPVYALLGAPEKLGVHYAQRAHAITAEDWGALLDFSEQQLGRRSSTRRFDQFPPAAFEMSRDASPAQRVALYNGRDLSGWTLYLKDETIDPKSVLRQSAGVLGFDTTASGYLKTELSFSNYHLHVEWRWPTSAAENANSGVLVHLTGPDAIWPLSFECQLKNGNAGQVVGMGLDIPAAPLLKERKRAPRRASPSEHPLGEWNSYEIYAHGDELLAFVNGVLQNHVRALPQSAGQIALQIEGFPIEFRNVWLEPNP